MVKTSPIHLLREYLNDRGLDGFIIPRGDEYLGEFVPPSAERLAWLTGFTGSAGVAVVHKEKAAVFSDGRYDIQIRAQVDEKDFEILNIAKMNVEEWMAENVPGGSKIGYDPMLHTPAQIKKYSCKCKAKSITLVPVADNPIDGIWADRPESPHQDVIAFPEKFAGRSSADKRSEIASQLKNKNLFGALLVQPDSIAWLLNIRGSDLPHNPFALSRAFIHADNGHVDWFIDKTRLENATLSSLGKQVSIISPVAIKSHLRKIAKAANDAGKAVQIDPDRSPVFFQQLLKDENCAIDKSEDPCLLPRACKTETEQEAMRRAHIIDGVAVVRFLYWLDQKAAAGALSEMDAAAQIRAFRSEHGAFKDTSFDTISGFGPNGAIVHYRVTEDTNLAIKPPGLLLVDSGGQYLDDDIAGTTDITRTIAVGDIDERLKRHFTRVLKGHINLASAHFPEGTIGSQIDTFAREPLWEASMDYAHGTGHGVGCYLSVHEEAASLSPKGKRALKTGMILSNEPGYYEAGSHGIRIENLVLVKESGETLPDGRKLLGFETITLAPIDRNAIMPDMLSESEKEWLNNYHRHVFDMLSPHLEKDICVWLNAACSPL